MYEKRKIDLLMKEHPILAAIMDLKPVFWQNPHQKKMAEMPNLPMDKSNMLDAEALWIRFAPFLKEAFPETAETNGKVESALKEIPEMKKLLNTHTAEIKGKLLLKCDNDLPIAGSIKARGGFFEVMHYAEKLAVEAEILKEGDSYRIFNSPKFKDFFSSYHIGVGSTGNLGLSIGTISAALGFKVTVYASADAKQWKKDLLRKRGVIVEEFSGDFSEAILAGRQKTQADPMGYFIDDENSHELFLGYAVGAHRLSKQLKQQNIKVDAEHPLFVYSPCGVGGSPGGTAFGLKQIFGDNVHCFLVEPTHSPAVLAGLVTGEMSNICVQDLGIDNKTEADGLAVGRPSNFATNLINHLISGHYTIEDEHLYTLLAQLYDSEHLFLEPSATAGLIGPQKVLESDYAEKQNLKMENATHVVWATGGKLVPERERKAFYQRGNKSL